MKILTIRKPHKVCIKEEKEKKGNNRVKTKFERKKIMYKLIFH